MSPSSDQPDWALISRYVTGDASPAEAAAVERWFSADSAHRELLEELRAVWGATGGSTAGWDTEAAITALRDRARTRPSVARPAPNFAVAPSRSRGMLVAGAGLAVAAVSLLAVSLKPAPRPAPMAAAPVPAPTDVTTRRGQQAEIRLRDGTGVVLSAASTLRYFSDYGQRERRVILEGEGYFVVAHDPAKPFRVESANGVAEDLGTAFVVRARGTSALQVVVTEGTVVLRPVARDSLARLDSLVLTRGQLGRVLPDGGLTFRSRVDTTAHLAWTRGELVFADTPLAEVAAELSRWYDADVRVARAELARRPFSGRIKRRSIEDAVKLVAAVTDAAVRRTADGWTFR